MNLTKLKLINWVKLRSRDIDVAIESIYMGGLLRKYFKRNGVSFNQSNFIAISDGNLFFDQTEVNAIKAFFKSQSSIVHAASEVTKRFIYWADRYEQFIKKYKVFDFINTDTKTLRKIYEQYLDLLHTLIPYSVIVSIGLEHFSQKIITESLSKLTKGPVQVYTAIMVPKRVNVTTLEYRSRIDLANQLLKSNRIFTPKLERLMTNHIQKYGALWCYRPTDEPMTIDVLRDDLLYMTNSNLPSVRQYERKHTNAIEKANKLVTRYKLPKDILMLVKIMKQNV